MKKYSIIALALILTATLLAGCRRRPNDMDTNPGDTSLPTGDMIEPTTHWETEPHTEPMTTVPRTDPTETEPGHTGATTPTDDIHGATEETTNESGIEGRFRRRVPGM